MKAYSQDLRLRILRAVDAGMTKAVGARRFEVALSSVKVPVAQRAKAAPSSKGVPGPAPRIGPNEFAAVAAQVRATPDATLAEHARKWEQTRGVRVSPWGGALRAGTGHPSPAVDAKETVAAEVTLAGEI